MFSWPTLLYWLRNLLIPPIYKGEFIINDVLWFEKSHNLDLVTIFAKPDNMTKSRVACNIVPVHVEKTPKNVKINPSPKYFEENNGDVSSSFDEKIYKDERIVIIKKDGSKKKSPKNEVDKMVDAVKSEVNKRKNYLKQNSNNNITSKNSSLGMSINYVEVIKQRGIQ